METKAFTDLNLSAELLRAIEQLGFEEATPIQSQSIPLLMEGRDMLAQSPTGTGKTVAFGIPILERIDPEDRAIQALILCPTRELVLQTSESLRTLAQFKPGIEIAPVYGGQQIERQILALKRHPQIVIATPGRLMDHMDRKTILLDGLRMVVLDEGDEMLNMGFREDIDAILQAVPAQRQTVLFTATLSKEIRQIAETYQREPVQVKVAHGELAVPGIEQYYVEARGNAKVDALTLLIEHHRHKLCLVFCNTKKMVDELAQTLSSRGYSVEAIHGDLRQAQRDKVMKQYRSGDLDLLVATDVAARGIDVDDIDAVFNYDVPSDVEYYVHRIGRTGRANKKGVAYTFASGRDMGKLQQIMRYTKTPIKFLKLPSVADVSQQKTVALVDKVRHMLPGENLSRYVSLIEAFVEEDPSGTLTVMDVAAALLKHADADANRRLSHVFSIPNPEQSKILNPRGAVPQQMVRLTLNMGRDDGLTPRRLVGLLISRAGIDSRRVGDIQMQADACHVMIPERLKGAVLSLDGGSYHGKPLHVSPG